MPEFSAPTTVETTATVATAAPTHSIVDTGISLRDVSIVIAIIVGIIAVLTFVGNKSATKRREDQERSAAKRKEDQEDAAARTKQIMDSIDKSHGDSARDIRELTDKVKDGRTVLEKDIEAIKSVTRHDIAGVKTQIQASQHSHEKNAEEITKLRDRMTTQETNSKHQTDALNKLEITFGKKFEEMKDLIKSQGETSTAQFKELAISIREARTVAGKP
jgi:hypothetical protein